MATPMQDENEPGTYIPATQRPDGSWRKARRVKEGYVPQEEVPLYESKGKQWAKSKPIAPLGLHPDEVDRAIKLKQTLANPGLNEESVSKSAKKRAKKKASKENKIEKELAEKLERVLGDNAPKTKNITIDETNNEHKKSLDPAKRLKTLKKKLREIETLAQKIESGELKNPEKDQLEKLTRKDEIEEEISDLEAELS